MTLKFRTEETLEVPSTKEISSNQHPRLAIALCGDAGAKGRVQRGALRGGDRGAALRNGKQRELAAGALAMLSTESFSGSVRLCYFVNLFPLVPPLCSGVFCPLHAHPFVLFAAVPGREADRRRARGLERTGARGGPSRCGAKPAGSWMDRLRWLATRPGVQLGVGAKFCCWQGGGFWDES